MLLFSSLLPLSFSLIYTLYSMKLPLYRYIIIVLDVESPFYMGAA